MFERYTERARRVIFFARYEASQFGAAFIEPEHLLLGLLREDKFLFAKLLEGTVIGQLTNEIRGSLQQNAKVSTSVDMPVSHVSKRALAYAAEESQGLNHTHIETGHLLLALLRVESAVVPIMARYGLTLDSVREKIPPPQGARGLSFDRAPDALVSLRDSLAKAVERLTPEIEPGITFVPRRLP